MKKIIWTAISIVMFFSGFGQRYELWVGTSKINNVRGNYGFSNDSVLMIYSNASLLFPSKDNYFNWDDVNKMKYRNKSKNQLGMVIGTGAGLLALSAANNSFKKSQGEGLGVFMIVAAPVCILSGTLFGHLATSKKKNLALNGLNAYHKNQLLEDAIKRKK